jgi:hypothetical protein
MMGKEPRQTTSNIGHLNKPSIQALIHGLNRHYYSASLLPLPESNRGTDSWLASQASQSITRRRRASRAC